MMTEEVMSRDEAVQFLRCNLHLTDQAYITDDTNRFDLLEKIIRAFQGHIPFQNIDLLATPQEQRCVPTKKQIKESMTKGRGGLCLVLNTFMCDVIVALGYDAYTVGALGNPPFQDINHVVVIVRNLKNVGDVFLVDVGLAMPTLRAISLDFTDEAPVFCDSFQWYKYVKTPGDGIDKFSRRVAPRTSKPVCDEADFSTKYFFTLEQQSFDTLSELIDKHVYKNMEWKYSKEVILMQWPHGRAVAVLGDELKKENEDGQLKKVRRMESDEEWVSTILEEFPMLERSTVESAVKFSRKIQSGIDDSSITKQ